MWVQTVSMYHMLFVFLLSLMVFVFVFKNFFFFFFENIGRFDGERNRNMSDGHHECVLKLVTR